jgi:hypothetical protein
MHAQARYVLRHPWNARRTGRTTSPKKRFAPEISLRLLCVRASSYDCMPFCSHMSACGMQRASYDLTHASKFMTRAHIPAARWCLEWPWDVFMSHADIWTCVRAHESQPNSPTKAIFWTHHRIAWTAVSSTPMHMAVLGVLETAVIVR